MSVTQVKQSVGGWNVRLRGNIPGSLLSALVPFGHVAIVPGRVNVAEYGDNLLAAARYVGVYRTKADNQDGVVIGGVGMESWLGDENGGGDVFETELVFTADTFADVINGSLPPGGSITAGVISSVAGTYTGRHQWVTPRQVLDYVTSLFGAEWRVNNTGTLDAGTIAQLYTTTPKAILMSKRDASDLRFRALAGESTMTRESADYATRVVVLGQGEGDTIQVGTADAVSVPYKDIHGNTVSITRVVSESFTEGVNADTRAALFLQQFGQPQTPNVNLSTDTYDIKGDVQVGDYIYVYNTSAGFYDVANEETWNGEIIHPIKLRVVELSWSIRQGWTVAFRDHQGNWIDLSPYVFYEGGETNIVVGDLPRSLTGGGVTEPVGSRPTVDTSIPAAPVFTSTSVGSYQSDTTNTTKSAIRLGWSTPLNQDGSTIVDGDHYEIRYRLTQVIGYRVKWGQIGVPSSSPYKWGELEGNKWGAPVSAPVSIDPEWLTLFVPWGTNEATVYELSPGVEYEFQIRAVDAQTPPHLGPYSASHLVVSTGDLFAPSTPAAPVVAGNMTAIQVIHTLGKNSGGTYNLEPDLVRFNVHVGGSASFFPDQGNQVGQLAANAGMIIANSPAVGTFPIDPVEQVYVKVVAIDRAGNASQPSPAATVTVELIDDSHISSLTVSKLTAGTITADMILAAYIRTALVGARVEISNAGIEVFNTLGGKTVDIDSATGDVAITGRFTSDLLNGQRVEIFDHDFWGPALVFSPASIPQAPNPSEGYLSCDNEDLGSPWTTMTILGPTYDAETASFTDGYFSMVRTSSTPTEQKAELIAGRGTGLSPIEQSRFEVGVDSESYISHEADRISHFTNKMGFFSTTPISRPTVTGSRGGNAALASLLTALANLGLITNSTTA